MYAQPLTTPRSSNASLSTRAGRVEGTRSQNLDAGTYQPADREVGRGYGRSEGYAAPRPYVGGSQTRPLFRIF